MRRGIYYVNNAERMGKPPHTSTDEYIGPATYFLNDEEIVCPTKNVVPFLSSSDRSPYIRKCSTEAIYNYRDDFKKKAVTGCSTPRNKAPRFVYEAIDDIPGPGTYNPKIQSKKQGPIPIPKGNTGRLYVCRVDYNSSPVGPSIPTKLDENGYDIVDGKVYKIPPDSPSELALAQDSPREPMNTKGFKWSASKVPKCKWNIPEGPGPADYDVEAKPDLRKIMEEEYREMARRMTFIPRYIEAQQLRMVEEGLPGPSSYDVKTAKETFLQAESIYPTPFITAEKRFKTTIDDGIPGPDAYDTNKSTVRTQFISKSGSPFGVDGPRFAKKRVDDIPGPGAYDVKSPLIEKLKSKKCPYAIFEPPFNVTRSRDINFVPFDSKFKPGPSVYSPHIPVKINTVDNISSVFSSKVKRFTYKINPAPSPSSYSISDPYNKLKSKKSHNSKKLPFNSTNERKSIFQPKDIPGPSDYVGKDGIIIGNGYFFNRSPRFQDKMEWTPAPGKYFLHPSVDNSMYRAFNTFNLPVSENVLRQKIRLPPSETYSTWAKNLKKKKRLQAFEINPELLF